MLTRIATESGCQGEAYITGIALSATTLLHSVLSPYPRNSPGHSVGFLEEIQNTGLHNEGTATDDFLEYLLPETRYWWSKVNDFWEQGELITDDRARY